MTQQHFDSATDARKRPRLVMIGNGMAGMRTLEELLAIAPDRYDVTLFGAEPHPNYNRILLSPVLAGEQAFEDITLNGPDWYATHGVRLHTGSPVTALDRVRRTVSTEAGISVPYDRVLIATGSRAVRLPIPGADLAGVIGYRDIADTGQMIAATATATADRAVVIGGGLLGLEAANGLRCRGMDVTVVHLPATLMDRQLDATAGRMLQRALAARHPHRAAGADQRAAW